LGNSDNSRWFPSFLRLEMVNSDLFMYDKDGFVIGANKDYYEQHKDIIGILNTIENAKLCTASHSVIDASEADLIKLVKSWHEAFMVSQFEEKLQIISSFESPGKYCLLFTDKTTKFNYSKAIVVLNVSSTNSSGSKSYSCWCQSVTYETQPSLSNIVIGAVASVGLFALNPLLGIFGAVVTVIFAKASIPSEMRKALDFHLVKLLLATGNFKEEEYRITLSLNENR
jgi:hypothetical protein